MTTLPPTELPTETNTQPKSQPLEPLTDITVQLTGLDGNAFLVMSRVREALRKGGRRDLIEAFTSEATAGDYDHLLQTCLRFVRCS